MGEEGWRVDSAAGTVVLPAGTGKVVRVAAFCQGDAVDKAKAAGAEFYGLQDLAELIKGGELGFDVVVATPDAMRVCAASLQLYLTCLMRVFISASYACVNVSMCLVHTNKILISYGSIHDHTCEYIFINVCVQTHTLI